MEKSNLPLVLAVGHRFADLALEREILGSGVLVEDGNALSDRERRARMREAQALLVGTQTRLDGDLIRELRACRVIVRYGIGVDNIDVEAATAAGIPVANVPDYCIDEVSDHTVALLLAAARRVCEASAAARRGEWGVAPMAGVRRLRGQTAGIVGFGRIGRLTAGKLMAFGLSVLVFDPWVDAGVITAAGAKPAAWEDLLRFSDYVILHCPLTPATRGMINASALSLMKPTAWIINTSRGELVEEPALLEALRAGRIGGAALDVLAQEPPRPDHPLLKEPRALVTSHVAWFSQEATVELRRKAAEQVRQVLLKGERPSWQINEL